VYLARDVSGALDLAESLPDLGHCFAIGGAAIYRAVLALPDCQRAYLTRVEGSFGCDVFLPPLGPEWRCLERGPRQEEGGIGYHVEIWER
jgi:dihydrofolate reductase